MGRKLGQPSGLVGGRVGLGGRVNRVGAGIHFLNVFEHFFLFPKQRLQPREGFLLAFYRITFVEQDLPSPPRPRLPIACISGLAVAADLPRLA